MNSLATIVLLLLIVFAAVAFVRLVGGGPARGPISGARNDRVIEREVERPPTQRVVEREVVRPQNEAPVVEPPTAPAEPQRRVVEREIIREDPDVL